MFTIRNEVDLIDTSIDKTEEEIIEKEIH